MTNEKNVTPLPLPNEAKMYKSGEGTVGNICILKQATNAQELKQNTETTE